MIIKMNTKTGTVTEKPKKSDKNYTKEEMNVKVFNLLATALVGTAVKNFKTDKVRHLYIHGVAELAEKLLDEMVLEGSVAVTEVEE